MSKSTIRFNSEKSARGFAERTGGTFKVCHDKEESRFKVRVTNIENYKQGSMIEQPSQKPDSSYRDEWSDYAWEGDDY